MTLTDDLYHIAEHIGDDQPNLPEGAKNTLLLAAKRIDAIARWAIAKNGLDDAIDNRSPDGWDYWPDEMAVAEKALLEQLKEAEDE